MDDLTGIIATAACILAMVFVVFSVFIKPLPTVYIDPVTKECIEVVGGNFGCGDHYGKKYNPQWRRVER